MSDIEPYLLTTKDYFILEVMLDRCLGRDDPMASLLRRKLSKAVVIFRDDIPPTVVTLNSRVRFRVDDRPDETRILAHDEVCGLVGLTLPLTNRRGLAMLGLAEGQSIMLDRPDGATETIMVLQVLNQPEGTAVAVAVAAAAADGALPSGCPSFGRSPRPPRAASYGEGRDGLRRPRPFGCVAPSDPTERNNESACSWKRRDRRHHGVVSRASGA